MATFIGLLHAAGLLALCGAIWCQGKLLGLLREQIAALTARIKLNAHVEQMLAETLRAPTTRKNTEGQRPGQPDTRV